MAEAVQWPGGRNVRDLGGRPLRDGGATAYGRVFRSGAREHLTDAGWAAVKAAGVRTVVDLRNAPAETARTADHPAVRDESLLGVVVVAAPTEDPDDAEFLRVCGPSLDHPRSWDDNLRLAAARVANVLRVVADADGGVLVHCAGGRDRTGMICAMLLHLAGATEQAIVDEYADGWRGAGAYAGHGWAYDPGRLEWRRVHEPPAGPERLEREIAEREPAVRSWVRAFDGDAWLTSVGFDSGRVGVLKHLLRP